MEQQHLILTERQTALFEWVKGQHGDQRRKYGGQIYWIHLFRVADIASAYEHTNGTTEVGLCHDLLEDTTATAEDLRTKLLELDYTPKEAESIVSGVIALTDVYTKEAYPNLKRIDRKRKEAARLGRIYPAWQSVKYADIIDNAGSIIVWDIDFAKTYIPEKIMMLDRMRQGNIDLLIRTCAEIHSALQVLEQHEQLKSIVTE